MKDGALSVEEARQRLQLGRTCIYYQIERGRLRATREGSRLYIPLASIRATQTEREAIEAAAASSGMSRSDFCRVAINDAVAELGERAPMRLTGRKSPRRAA